MDETRQINLTDDNDDSTPDASTPSDDNSPLISLQFQEEEVATFDPQAFEATRNIISNQIEKIDEIKRKQKLFKEQIDDLVLNNESYQGAEELAKEATKKAKELKANIMQTQAYKELKSKIKELREDQKDLQESLSGHLLDLYQTTGVMEYESPGGDVYEYKISAKIGSKKNL